MKQFITTISLTPDKGLVKHYYEPQFETDTEPAETTSPTIAMIEMNMFEDDEWEVVVLLTDTEEARKNYETFLAELDEVSGRLGLLNKPIITVIDIPRDESDWKHVSLYRNLCRCYRPFAQLYADITFGTKATVISLFGSLVYAENVMRGRIEDIVYGEVLHDGSGQGRLFSVCRLFIMTEMIMSGVLPRNMIKADDTDTEISGGNITKQFFTSISLNKELDALYYEPQFEAFIKPQKTTSPTIAMMELNSEKGDVIEVIVLLTDTNEAEKNYRTFMTELDALSKAKEFSYIIKEVRIPRSESNEKHVGLYKNLCSLYRPDAKIYADITYGTKATVISLFGSLAYSEYFKDNRVEEIVYGENLHEQRGYGRLFSVRGLLLMTEMIIAGSLSDNVTDTDIDEILDFYAGGDINE